MASMQLVLDDDEDKIVQLYSLVNHITNKKQAIKEIIRLFGHYNWNDMISQMIEVKENGR